MAVDIEADPGVKMKINSNSCADVALTGALVDPVHSDWGDSGFLGSQHEEGTLPCHRMVFARTMDMDRQRNAEAGEYAQDDWDGVVAVVRF